jgi:hypothetical protein
VAALNARTLVIAQIESERGMAELEGIAATPGIDVLWLGHFDLTNFLGIPGEFESPKYLDAVRAIVATARRHGKGLGFHGGRCRSGRGATGRFGFNMIAAGLDSSLLLVGDPRDGYRTAMTSGSAIVRDCAQLGRASPPFGSWRPRSLKATGLDWEYTAPRGKEITPDARAALLTAVLSIRRASAPPASRAATAVLRIVARHGVG